MFIQSDENIYKIIDSAVSKMLFGVFMLWAFSIGYRSGGDNRRRKNEEKFGREGNDMLGAGRYPKPT